MEIEGLYNKIRHESKDRKKYMLHDGPPYANGISIWAMPLTRYLKTSLSIKADVRL
jgi:isoleucyl-tRNA synthetase